jgi:hypothetical protein
MQRTSLEPPPQPDAPVLNTPRFCLASCFFIAPARASAGGEV